MATFDRDIAIAFGPQSVEGTADSTISALSGSLTLADGLILGDSKAGIDKSGVSHAFTRREADPSVIAASFTRTDGDFLEEEVTLTFAFPLAGNRVDTTGSPVDADFEQEKGIKALLDACGLSGIASVSDPTIGWKYTPSNVSIATAKLFDSGFAWVIRDIRGNISFNLPPGEVPIATCVLKGIVDAASAILAFPTVDYEEQASVGAASVVGTATAWNSTRGFLECTIGIVNDLEEIPDSNATVGHTFQQNGRTITVDMTIKDDTADVDFSRTNLIQAIAATDDLKFTVGTAASGSDPAKALQIECANLRVLAYTPDTYGDQAASQVSAVCTGLTDGTEFFLAFL